MTRRLPLPAGSEPRAFAAIAAAAAFGLLLTGLGGCSDGSADTPPPSSPAPSAVSLEPALRDAAPDGFFVGAAVGGGGHLGGNDTLKLPDVAGLVGKQFSSVTPENAAKWEVIEPSQGTFDFGPMDEVVAFAQAHGQRVRGHNLLWHSQNPAWLTSGSLTPDQLRQILHDHISAVVGRYAGKVAQWDVANEIFDDSGQPRQENPFIKALGIGIVADAFRWAHEADPHAVLFLNDFGVETPGPKVDAYVALVKQLQADGVPVGGFGIQGHLASQYGFPGGLQGVMQQLADLGLDVEVTELDVRVPVSAAGEAQRVDVLEQARWYGKVATACLAVARCTGITVWGVSDRYSWVPTTFPGEGAALLFDDALAPKPAFAAFREALAAGRG